MVTGRRAMATDDWTWEVTAKDRISLTECYDARQCATENDEGGIITECAKLASWPARKENEESEDVYVLMLTVTAQQEEQQLKLDMKYLEKPGLFDGKETAWSDWKFRMLNWFGAMDAQIPEYLEHAELRDTEIALQADDRVRRLGSLIFVVLTSYLQHRELKLLQRVGSQNGYEAWRQLVRSFEPRLRQRKLRLLDEVRHFNFLATSARAFESKVMEWEQLIKVLNFTGTDIACRSVAVFHTASAPRRNCIGLKGLSPKWLRTSDKLDIPRLLLRFHSPSNNC